MTLRETLVPVSAGTGLPGMGRRMPFSVRGPDHPNDREGLKRPDVEISTLGNPEEARK